MFMQNDLVEKFSSHLKSVLTRALCFAVETNEQVISPEHLLWALSTEKGCLASELIKKSGIKQSDVRKWIGATPQSEHMTLPQGSAMLTLSDDAKRAVEKAVFMASAHGHPFIGTEHLLLALLEVNIASVQTFLSHLQIDLDGLKRETHTVLTHASSFSDMTQAHPSPLPLTHEPKQRPNESETDRFAALRYFGRELTSPEEQKRIDPVIGRDMEIERVMEILCRRNKNNPLLLGEPGVGKTAVVEGLAKHIVEGTVPPALQKKRIFAIDMTLVVAGTMYRGEFEARLRQIIEEAQKAEEVILFIDELHSIIGAGSSPGSMDAANILKPALARGDLCCIGATTLGEFKKHIEADSALERRFQSVLIDEPDESKSIEILQGVAPYYESFHGVRITPDAIEQAVKLSTRFIQDRRLPDKAIDLLDEASARARMRKTDIGPTEHKRFLAYELEELRKAKREAIEQERFEEAMTLKQKEESLQQLIEQSPTPKESSTVSTISSQEIAHIISRLFHIPVEDLLHQSQTSQDVLLANLQKHILGQNQVLTSVSRALARAKSGLIHPHRPLASFLFLGPSGVGKTELAKAIAKTFFQSDKHLIRLDMSEYAEGFTMSKLIGAPAGYVGYKEQAHLTDRVRQKPYSVVLFDELEKAHKDVQNLLLQMLEEGEITDATGRVISFKNTIVVVTSNVGLEAFDVSPVGFEASSPQKLKPTDVRKELEEKFRPELLNRLDETCLFERLDRSVLEQICKKHLHELSDRLKTHNITLTFSDSVVKFLVDQVEPKFGARTIRHAIQSHVESFLADHMTKKKHSGSWKMIHSGTSLRLSKQK